METCKHCGATVPSTDHAIDAGWIPSYWDMASQIEIDGSFCPSCVNVLGLIYDDAMCDFYKP